MFVTLILLWLQILLQHQQPQQDSRTTTIKKRENTKNASNNLFRNLDLEMPSCIIFWHSQTWTEQAGAEFINLIEVVYKSNLKKYQACFMTTFYA